MAEPLFDKNSDTWVVVDDGIATVGLTRWHTHRIYMYVDRITLPEPGKSVAAGSEIGEVDCDKSTTEVITPVSGEVVECNRELQAIQANSGWLFPDDPENVWFFRIRLSNPAELDGLVTRSQYRAYIKELEGPRRPIRDHVCARCGEPAVDCVLNPDSNPDDEQSFTWLCERHAPELRWLD